MKRHKHVEQMNLKEFKAFRTNLSVKDNNFNINRKLNHILRTEPDDKFRADEIKQWKKLLK